MLKCCHIWFGLYKQDLEEGQKLVIEIVHLEEDARAKKGPEKEKKKERSSDFLAPPTAKRLLVAHMDPEQAVAISARISAIIEKQKSKSETNNKGTLVAGAKASKKKLMEDASATRGGQTERQDKQPEKQKKKVASPPAKQTRVLFNFL